MRFACGSALADVELFSLKLATAVAAIPGTAPRNTATTAATAATTATIAATANATTATITNNHCQQYLLLCGVILITTYARP